MNECRGLGTGLETEVCRVKRVSYFGRCLLSGPRHQVLRTNTKYSEVKLS